MLDEGVDGDFFISRTTVQHIFTLAPPTLMMTFRQDGLNEPDETFSMKLESNSDIDLPSGPGVFYRQVIQCTIIDGDGKR